MDKKYLHKVIDRLVSETRIDYDEEKLYLPFLPLFSPLPFLPPPPLTLLPPFSPDSFYKHSRDVYGLTEEEVEYVWKKYKLTITTLIQGNNFR